MLSDGAGSENLEVKGGLASWVANGGVDTGTGAAVGTVPLMSSKPGGATYGVA